MFPVLFFSPVNFLDHTQHKGLAVAVYGVLFCKLVGMVLSHHPLPFTKDVTNKGMVTRFLASWRGEVYLWCDYGSIYLVFMLHFMMGSSGRGPYHTPGALWRKFFSASFSLTQLSFPRPEPRCLNSKCICAHSWACWSENEVCSGALLFSGN